MSNEVVIRDEVSYDMILNDIDKMYTMARKLMQSKHYQAMGEAGIFAITQKAKSLKMDPLDALNGGLYYVQGKVGMSTESMAALIRQAGHSIVKDAKSDATKCILHGKRKDNGDTWTVSFSWEDAKRAGLAKNMFDKYPEIMLYNRAMSTLARQLFPDVIKGAGYDKDELMEIARSRPAFAEVEIQDAPKQLEIKSITEEQFETLNDMIGENLDLRDKVEEFLKKSLNVSRLQDLPSTWYDKIFARVKLANDQKETGKPEVKNDE